ncbi:NmrA-like family domain-containing protein 1 [Colletotrichum tropicale]|nr:NmrA-like family domain-containing protein 1 [Colletotrichum tropicale]
MTRLLTVFGATGGQGRSVVNAVLADPSLSTTFRIRAITRDVSSTAAQQLVALGVEVVQADMFSKPSLSCVLEGSHTVFLMTMPQVPDWKAEVVQGKNVADVAAEVGVEHLFFSSLLHMSEMTNGRLKNAISFETKAEVERYIRAKSIPSTFVLAGYFMNNYLLPPFQNFKKADDGTFIWACPVSEQARFPLIDHEKDVGKYVVAGMRSPSTVLGKRLFAAVDYYTPSRIISEFQEVVGKTVQFIPTDEATYKKRIPPPVGDVAYDIDRVFDDVGYFAGEDLEESLNLLARSGLKLTTWKDFLEVNIAAFK